MIRRLIIATIMISGLFVPAPTHPNFLNIAKQCGYWAGLNFLAIAKIVCEPIGHKRNKEEFSRLECYNNNPEYIDIISELISQYAPGHSIKIYSDPEPIYDEFQAFAISNSIILCSSLIKTLKDPNNKYHGMAKIIVGHEMGHIIHGHGNKFFAWTVGFSVITSLIANFGLQKANPKNKWINILITGTAMVGKVIGEILVGLWKKRTYEREADMHAMTYTDDIETLRAIEKMWKDQARYEHKLSYFDRALRTHPMSQERAAAYGRRIKELEAQQS